MRRLLWAAALLLALHAIPQGKAADTAADNPPEAQPGDGFPELHILNVARGVELDMSGEEVVGRLTAGGLSIDQQRDLPPDGLTRMILAVPEDDDCIPRGAQLVCPAIRVFLVNDPQRGYRVSRIEAYQRIDAAITVAQVFEKVSAAMGPALQTEMWPEQVRGGSVVVWRQRWREDLTAGVSTEVVATQDPPDRLVLGIADPNARATGIGVVVADLDLEGAFASVRRRLQLRPQR